MKRITAAFTVLAVIIGLGTSCQKEMENRQEISGSGTGLKVTATIADNGTKVSYQEDGTSPNPGLQPAWEVDDIIIGFDDAEPSKTYAYKVVSVGEQTKKATLERITDGVETVKGTATSDPADNTKMYMFYAPGTTPDKITSKSLTVSLTTQAKDVVPALMMAEATVTNGSLSLQFSNQTAIIGVKAPVMADKNKSYTSLALSGSTGLNTEIKFDLDGDKNLKASYQTPGTLTKELNFTSNSETGKGPDVIYIVACPAEKQDLSFKFNGTEEYFNVKDATINVGNYYRLEGPETKAMPVFSVASGTKVSFAKGNLYAKKDGTDWTWGFYDKQYQFNSESMPKISTSGGSRTAASRDTEIDLFTWGYDNTSTNTSYSLNPVNTAGITSHTSTGDQLVYTDSGDDWGVAYCNSNGITVGTWRTLSKDEWEWLLGPSSSPTPGTNCRTSRKVGSVENARYLKCKVNDGTRDVYGLMIFPDEFTWPSGAGDAPTSGINTANLAWTSVPCYTAVQFEALEGAGVVFLPAAGYRSGTGVTSVGSNGYYWSSTASDSSGAYCLSLVSSNVGPASGNVRYYGRSVRLVSVVQ